MTVYWYENGEKKSSADDIWPEGRYAFVDGEFTRLTTTVRPTVHESKRPIGKGKNARIGPQVIKDTINDTKSMITGKTHDSSSRYKQELKEQGCHIVEKGEIHSDMNYKRQQVGDYNCRKELRDALHQHLPHMR